MKVKKGGLPTIELTYSHLNKRCPEAGPDGRQLTVLGALMTKFHRAQVDSVTACRLNRVVKAVRQAQRDMEEEYIEEIGKVFDKKLEADGLKKKTDAEVVNMSEEEQDKFRGHDLWLNEQNRLFGQRVAKFTLMPLGPQHLQGIQISAAEIDALGGLYDEEGKVRPAAFRKGLGLAPESGSA